MHDTFTHDSRFFCLVFEPLGVSLYDFLKSNNFRGFWAQDIQSFARQCLRALKFLHNQLQMTHTDLKPENILLQSQEAARQSYFPREEKWQETHKSSKGRNATYLRPASSQIKLIDFGNATYYDEHHSSIINTRQYRGPEVVLELGWSERSDLWSLGCIFMELYTGDLLFGTHENFEHLALMQATIEPFPRSMLANASQTVKEKYLTRHQGDWRLNWPDGASSTSSERHVRSQRPLADIVVRHHRPLAACVGSLLTLDPERRPSASESLRHPFFLEQFDD
jgi:dual-specificity kinase